MYQILIEENPRTQALLPVNDVFHVANETALSLASMMKKGRKVTLRSSNYDILAIYETGCVTKNFLRREVTKRYKEKSYQVKESNHEKTSPNS